MKGFLYLVFVKILSTQGSILKQENADLCTSGASGHPLFLTPFIESGKIEEARQLSRVAFTESSKLGFKSYSGFFTVNKKYNSNHFFWYFPAMENATDAPVVVWLAGGPGTSSMFSLFDENGPIRVINELFERREFHWAKSHHLVYIDNPVGAGFSFTDDPKGYCTDQTQVGEQLYSTVVQFFQLFSELRQNKLFVFGESYGGKYAPALAYMIAKRNPNAQVKINLKGIGIGNGLSDPVNQLQYSKYLYQIGLLGWNEAKQFEEEENKIVNLIQKEYWKEAEERLMSLYLRENNTLFNNMTGFRQYYNYINFNYALDLSFVSLLQNSCVRRNIHVGSLAFNASSHIVFKHLKEDILKSVAPWISELLEHYYVMAYNGQLDIVVAYPLTTNYLRKLKFSGAEEYKNAKRNIWRVDDEFAGYTRQGGKLIDALIRNAAHAAPMDQPKWTLALITRFTHHAIDESFEVFSD